MSRQVHLDADVLRELIAFARTTASLEVLDQAQKALETPPMMPPPGRRWCCTLFSIGAGHHRACQGWR